MHLHQIVSRKVALAGALMALATALPSAPLAHADDYTSVAQQVSQAIAGTRSNQMTADISTTDLTMHLEMIVVGSGAKKSYYMKDMIKDKSGSHTFEVEATDKQTCYRQQKTWQCAPAAKGGIYQTLLDNPFQFAAAQTKLPTGDSLHVTSLGFKTIQGQGCIGYQLLYTSAKEKLQGSGQFWLNAASKLPVIEDLRTTGKTALSFKSVWSRWNDPTLSLPPVR
jgi:hypothetical protein